jgi:hypothetical protein
MPWGIGQRGHTQAHRQNRFHSASPGKHEDGGGLRLVVSQSGARRWVFRFTLSGRRREMGLGSYPDIGSG